MVVSQFYSIYKQKKLYKKNLMLIKEIRDIKRILPHALFLHHHGINDINEPRRRETIAFYRAALAYN